MRKIGKILAPLIEIELSFSTGTFLNNYDVINRKLKPLLIRWTVGKQAKKTPDIIVKTTTVLYSLPFSSRLSGPPKIELSTLNGKSKFTILS